MGAKFFDSTVLGSAEKALDFIGNVLESSTEYSVIGKDLDGKATSQITVSNALSATTAFPETRASLIS